MKIHNFYREKPEVISVGDIKHRDFKSELAKISSIDFGKCSDYPFLLGIKISFSGNGTGCFTDISMNMSNDCKWDYPTQRQKTAEKIMQFINDILTDAKKQDVSELIGTPVELYMNMKTNFVMGVLIGFRILKEVL